MSCPPKSEKSEVVFPAYLARFCPFRAVVLSRLLSGQRCGIY